MKGKFSSAFEETFPTLYLFLANICVKITSVILVREAIHSVFASGLSRNIGWSSLINDLAALGLNQGLRDLWGEGRKRAMSYIHQHKQSGACNVIMAMYLLSLLHLSALHLVCSKTLHLSDSKKMT